MFINFGGHVVFSFDMLFSGPVCKEVVPANEEKQPGVPKNTNGWKWPRLVC